MKMGSLRNKEVDLEESRADNISDRPQHPFP